MAIGGGKKSGGNGGRKGRWVTLGYLWEGDSGAKYAASGRLDCLPVDGNWDGKIFLYPNTAGKNQKNPADYKLTALVGGGEDSSSGGGNAKSKGDDEEGDDFDANEPEGEEPEEVGPSGLGLKKASDLEPPPKKQQIQEEGPTTCGFCGETVTKDTIYCPLGKELRAADPPEGCRLGLPRDPEDVPEGEIPF